MKLSQASSDLLSERWYAVHVFPRQEKRVARYLGLKNIGAFLPTYRVARRWNNGCLAQLDLPLFPGYLFARLPLRDRLRVLQSPGVAQFVSFGGTPAAISDDEIEAWRHGLAQCPAEPHPCLAIGDRVRVRSGPFAGMSGILLRRKQYFRVVLSMEILSKSVAVELDVSNLEELRLSSIDVSSYNALAVGRIE